MRTTPLNGAGLAGAGTVGTVGAYQSLERALALLSAFDDDRTELGVSEIARSLGVHRSTASRMAATLERARYLSRSGDRYRLGAEMVRLGGVAARGFDVVAAVQPAMELLSQLTGETVNLAVPDGGDVLNVAELPSAFILSSSSSWTGRRTRPHAVANGKVLLAWGALAVPAGSLERYTSRTVTSKRELARELREIRQLGYATAVAELEEGLVAVAAPVFDGAGRCVAALSLSGPEVRLRSDDLDRLGRLCAAAPASAGVPSGVAPVQHQDISTRRGRQRA